MPINFPSFRRMIGPDPNNGIRGSNVTAKSFNDIYDTLDQLNGIPTADELVEVEETTAKLDSRVFDVRDYGAGTGVADNIAAINAAITAANAAGGGRVVVPGTGVWPVRPAGTSNYVLMRSNVTLDLSDARLRVASDVGDYSKVIGQVNSRIVRAWVTGGCIDHNAGAVEGTDIEAGTDASCLSVHFWDFDTAGVDGVTADAVGVNTFCLADIGTDSRMAIVRRSTVNWQQGATTSDPDYDNSAIYIEALGTRVIDNTFYTPSLSEAARGCIEVHGQLAVVTGNTGENFQSLINITPEADIVTPLPRGNITVTGNGLTNGLHGVRLWPFTGKTISSVLVAANTFNLLQKDWDGPSASGVSVERGSAYAGDIDGLTVETNIIEFQPGDDRAITDYLQTVAVSVNASGETRNFSVKENIILNAPALAIRIGDQENDDKVVSCGQVGGNIIVDAGCGTGVDDGARSAFGLYGTLEYVDILPNKIHDTGATLNGKYEVVSFGVAGEGNTYHRQQVTTVSGTALGTSMNKVVLNTGEARATLAFGTVAANSADGRTVTVYGAKEGDAVIVTPQFSIAAGVTFYGAVTADDTVLVVVYNHTGSGAAVGTLDWMVRVVK